MGTRVVFIENENEHFDLVKSLNLADIAFHRLFEGGEWTTYFNKIQIYLDGLQEIDSEYVILADSRDVLFYKDIGTINKTYKKYYNEYDIVVQAEDDPRGCRYFRKTDLTRYSFNDELYKYPCSGLIMGKRTVLIDFFKELIEKTPGDWRIADQPAVEWGMANLDYKITIDSDCRLFQQMGMGDYSGVNFDLHFNKNFVRNTRTNSEPCIFHGAGKAFLNPIWKIIHKRY